MSKPKRPCGHSSCKVSCCINEVTLTFGRGRLDEFGFWEIPCWICAEAHKKESPKHFVWPDKNNVINL